MRTPGPERPAAGAPTGGDRRLVLAALLLAQTMASFDGSVTSVAGPVIRADLRTSAAGLQLIAAAYVLSFAGLVVLGSRLGGDRGFRRMFAVGLAAFTAASVACGLSPNATVLVAARAAQGAAGALMVPQVLSLIQVLYDGKSRQRAVALYAAVLAVGTGGGQIVGGLVATADLLGLSWRPVFFLNVPAAVAVAVLARSLPSAGRRDGRRLDMAGAGVLLTAMTLLLVPLIFGRELGWPPWTWAAFAASAGAWAAFAAREMGVNERGGVPLLDPELLAVPGLARALLTVCAVMGGYAGLLFTVTLHLQAHERFSAAAAGLAIAPYPLSFGIVSVAVRRLPGPVRDRLPVAGPLMLASAGSGVLLLARGGWPAGPSSVLLAVAAAGQAVAFGPTVAAALAGLAPALSSSASGLISTGSVLSQALGIAAVGDAYLAGANGRPASTGRGLAAAAVVVSVPLILSAFAGRRLRLDAGAGAQRISR